MSITSWFFIKDNLLPMHMRLRRTSPVKMSIPDPQVKEELKTLVLLRFCSTPITWEYLIFLKQETVKKRKRVKQT